MIRYTMMLCALLLLLACMPIKKNFFYVSVSIACSTKTVTHPCGTAARSARSGIGNVCGVLRFFRFSERGQNAKHENDIQWQFG